MANGEDQRGNVKVDPEARLVDADGVVDRDPTFAARLDKEITAILAEAESDGDGTVKLASSAVKLLVARALAAEDDAQKATEERDAERELARVDSLTKLPNRRALLEALDVEIRRAGRYNQPVSLILIDIDHFKRVNDTMGHAGGDEVLKDFAELFRGLLRLTTGDILGRYGIENEEKVDNKIGRYGGEEFICIAPHTNGAAALIAERLRAGVEALSKTDPRHPDPITISVGVATFYPDLHGAGDSAANLIERADKAMYLAKEGGRNRVVVLNEKESPAPFELTSERLAELQAKYGGQKEKDSTLS